MNIDEMPVGDSILVAPDAYATVYSLGHKQPEKEGTHLEITSRTGTLDEYMMGGELQEYNTLRRVSPYPDPIRRPVSETRAPESFFENVS